MSVLAVPAALLPGDVDGDVAAAQGFHQVTLRNSTQMDESDGEMALPHLSFTVLSTLNVFSVLSLGEGNAKKTKKPYLSSIIRKTLPINSENPSHLVQKCNMGPDPLTGSHACLSTRN